MKDRNASGSQPETVISIIGPGMKLVGDVETDGTVRIEGTVEGTIKAGKAVVVGKEGFVDGDIDTQDAVIAGRVEGTITAESRLEVQASSRLEGEIFARRMQLEEGAIMNGTLHMGETPPKKLSGRDNGGRGDTKSRAPSFAGSPDADDSGSKATKAGAAGDAGSKKKKRETAGASES